MIEPKAESRLRASGAPGWLSMIRSQRSNNVLPLLLGWA